MLVTVLVVLFVLWLLGFSFHLAAGLSGLLTVLLVVALAVYLFDHLGGRNRL